MLNEAEFKKKFQTVRMAAMAMVTAVVMLASIFCFQVSQQVRGVYCADLLR